MGIYPITLTRELSTWFGRTDTVDVAHARQREMTMSI